MIFGEGVFEGPPGSDQTEPGGDIGYGRELRTWLLRLLARLRRRRWFFSSSSAC